MRIKILNVRYSTALGQIVLCYLRVGPNGMISCLKLVKILVVEDAQKGWGLGGSSRWGK